MNSFKKVALGLVAAMTLGTIVATPASANTLTLTVASSVSGTGSAADPYKVKVPFDNVVTDVTTVGSQEALTLNLSNLTVNLPVTIVGTGNVRFVTALGLGVNSTSGATSITFNPLTTTGTVYAFTTSTSASAITVSVGVTTQTVYLKGIAGEPYFLTASVPASGHLGSKVMATVNVTDIFGNPATAVITGTALNATVAPAVVDPVLLAGKYTAEVTLPALAGTAAVNFAIPNAVDVPTLAIETTTATSVISVVDLVSTLAAEKAARDAAAVALAKALADAKAAADKALTDAAAAHAAELSFVKAVYDAVSAAVKKAFNALAKKWNKANPKAKVALIK